jgi:hypothetical protein
MAAGSSKSGFEQLLTAASARNFTEVARLMSAGVSIETRDKDGFTVLHHAVRSGNLEMLTGLVDLGADVTASTKKGEPPLVLFLESLAGMSLGRVTPDDAQAMYKLLNEAAVKRPKKGSSALAFGASNDGKVGGSSSEESAGAGKSSGSGWFFGYDLW